MIDDHVITGRICWELIKGRGNRQMIHPQFISKLLEFALTALRTKHAVVVSFRKEKLQDDPPALPNAVVGRDDVHAISYRQDAARHKPGRSIHLNHTHSASSPIGEGRMMTQGWDVNTIFLSCLQYGDPFWDLQLSSVHIDLHCFAICFHIPSLSDRQII
jgi:hypothetical protein